jgi:hypothetical protein
MTSESFIFGIRHENERKPHKNLIPNVMTTVKIATKHNVRLPDQRCRYLQTRSALFVVLRLSADPTSFQPFLTNDNRRRRRAKRRITDYSSKVSVYLSFVFQEPSNPSFGRRLTSSLSHTVTSILLLVFLRFDPRCDRVSFDFLVKAALRLERNET